MAPRLTVSRPLAGCCACSVRTLTQDTRPRADSVRVQSHEHPCVGDCRALGTNYLMSSVQHPEEARLHVLQMRKLERLSRSSKCGSAGVQTQICLMLATLPRGVNPTSRQSRVYKRSGDPDGQDTASKDSNPSAPPLRQPEALRSLTVQKTIHLRAVHYSPKAVSAHAACAGRLSLLEVESPRGSLEWW